MSVEQINAVRYKCKCDHADCKYEWESDFIPPRCASCKKYTWNHAPIRYGWKGNPIAAFGESKTAAEWSREYKISSTTIRARIGKGWTAEKAIATPVGKVHQQSAVPNGGKP